MLDLSCLRLSFIARALWLEGSSMLDCLTLLVGWQGDGGKREVSSRGARLKGEWKLSTGEWSNRYLESRGRENE